MYIFTLSFLPLNFVKSHHLRFLPYQRQKIRRQRMHIYLFANPNGKPIIYVDIIFFEVGFFGKSVIYFSFNITKEQVSLWNSHVPFDVFPISP